MKSLPSVTSSILLLCLAGNGLTQETRDSKKAVLPGAVAERIRQFESEVESVQKKANSEIQASRLKLIEDLEALASASAKAGKLDEYVAIQERIKELKAAPQIDPKTTSDSQPGRPEGLGREGQSGFGKGQPANSQHAKHQNANHLVIDLGHGVHMEFVLIPAGEFLMGSANSDKDAVSTEKPQHRVRITREFYLAKYPVTQEQYQALMGTNPSMHGSGGLIQRFNPGLDARRLPVERVSWDAATLFCAECTRRDKQGRTFKLPTEAEWEYAARAGTATRYFFGDEATDLPAFAWYRENSAIRTPKENMWTHPVGAKKPNAWGLYDMLGNVGQWCSDKYSETYYAHSPVEDPQGADSGFHIVRGGSFGSPALACRVASRGLGTPDKWGQGGNGLHPTASAPAIGFRVAINLGKNNSLSTDH